MAKKFLVNQGIATTIASKTQRLAALSLLKMLERNLLAENTDSIPGISNIPAVYLTLKASPAKRLISTKFEVLFSCRHLPKQIKKPKPNKITNQSMYPQERLADRLKPANTAARLTQAARTPKLELTIPAIPIKASTPQIQPKTAAEEFPDNITAQVNNISPD